MEQSSTRICGGSPPGVVTVWRRRMTCPPPLQRFPCRLVGGVRKRRRQRERRGEHSGGGSQDHDDRFGVNPGTQIRPARVGLATR